MMRRAWTVGVLGAHIAGFAASAAAQESLPPAPEVARLLRESQAPARFRDHKPQFEIRPQTFTFRNGAQSVQETYYAVVDGPRYVALCDPQNNQVNVLAASPEAASTKLELTAPLDARSGPGTRLAPEVRLLGRAVETDQHDCHFSQEEAAAVVVFRQEWSLPRKGHATHVFRFRCDPARGYVVDVTTQVALAAAGAKKPPAGEIIGVLSIKPSRLDSPWPGESPFDRTVYTPRGGIEFGGWWNNLGVAPRLHGRDDFLPLRAGGFLAFVGEKGSWAPSISYPDTTIGSALHRVDPATLEQHCYVASPVAAAGDTAGPLVTRLEYSSLPPEATARLAQRANLGQWETQHAVMLRLGTPEDFEAQPLPLNTGVRALLSPAYVLSTKEAHSGKNSLIVLGTPANRQNGAKPQVTAPAVPLTPNSRYRVTVWAKSASGVTEGLVSVALHAGPDLQDEGARRVRTPGAKTGEGWKELTLEFATGPSPAYADLRFQAIGNGAVYFDDFAFTRLDR